MIINWYGEGSFKIQTGGVTILTDPFESSVGLSAPRFKADITLNSGPFPAYKSDKEIEGNSVVGAGEYEIKGVDISGLGAGQGTVYILKTENLKLGFLGQLALNNLSENAMESLTSCDILLVPVGGEPYLEPAEAAKLTKKLEPKMVVPYAYKIPGLKRESMELKDFEKEFGQKVTPEEKLTIKIKDITWEGTKIFALQP
jgi:L-ascorbate metabolism protein UlaG (beta-lactamase superfamily)